MPGYNLDDIFGPPTGPPPKTSLPSLILGRNIFDQYQLGPPSLASFIVQNSQHLPIKIMNDVAPTN